MLASETKKDTDVGVLFLDVIGGDEGDRTPDLMNAIHALSQLSYVPLFSFEFLVPSFGLPETTKFESIENA